MAPLLEQQETRVRVDFGHNDYSHRSVGQLQLKSMQLKLRDPERSVKRRYLLETTI